VVAEGVETSEQLDFLREQGCDEAQGFLLAPPVEAGEVIRWLAPSAIVVRPVSGVGHTVRPLTGRGHDQADNGRF
jgi:predicted signal transduction protein with EAL and GGDEF domain